LSRRSQQAGQRTRELTARLIWENGMPKATSIGKSLWVFWGYKIELLLLTACCYSFGMAHLAIRRGLATGTHAALSSTDFSTSFFFCRWLKRDCLLSQRAFPLLPYDADDFGTAVQRPGRNVVLVEGVRTPFSMSGTE
jgi:hypothetical protein